MKFEHQCLRKLTVQIEKCTALGKGLPEGSVKMHAEWLPTRYNLCVGLRYIKAICVRV